MSKIKYKYIHKRHTNNNKNKTNLKKHAPVKSDFECTQAQNGIRVILHFYHTVSQIMFSLVYFSVLIRES